MKNPLADTLININNIDKDAERMISILTQLKPDFIGQEALENLNQLYHSKNITADAYFQSDIVQLSIQKLSEHYRNYWFALAKIVYNSPYHLNNLSKAICLISASKKLGIQYEKFLERK